MSYLENALNHEPIQYFASAHANRASDFFASRAKFLIGIVEKVVDFVHNFFKLVVLDVVPAIINLEPGRANVKAGLNQMVDDLKDLPVGITGFIFGSSIAARLHDKIHGKVVLAPAVVAI